MASSRRARPGHLTENSMGNDRKALNIVSTKETPLAKHSAGIDQNVIGKTYPQGVREHVSVEIAMLTLVMQI